MNTHSITEEHCMKMVGDRVCPGCGGELHALETVDNADNPTFWAACKPCSTFSWGVDKRVHEIAKELVTNHSHTAFTDWELKEKYPAAWLQSQIRNTCFIVQKVLNIDAKMRQANNANTKTTAA